MNYEIIVGSGIGLAILIFFHLPNINSILQFSNLLPIILIKSGIYYSYCPLFSTLDDKVLMFISSTFAIVHN